MLVVGLEEMVAGSGVSTKIVLEMTVQPGTGIRKHPLQREGEKMVVGIGRKHGQLAPAIFSLCHLASRVANCL